MIRLNRPVFNGIECTHEEHRAILKQRRATLDAAASQWTSQQYFPVNWRHGYKATFKVLRRLPDASLCVRIVVTGPWKKQTYTRDIRLVRERNLPLSLRRG